MARPGFEQHYRRSRPATARGQARRERLLDATAGLVAARGFHSVGIAEIGAAAGVTGSAIYRHFRNKNEILVALFDRVLDSLLTVSAHAVEDAKSHSTALDHLVRAHATFALQDRTILAVYSQEFHNLPKPERSRLRRRQRLYVGRWVDVLRAASPELTEPAARARVLAAFGLLNSPANFDSGLHDSDLCELLVTMTLTALRAPVTRGRR